MKQRVLLHICCAPDATAAYERLSPDYDVIGFFHNPNIHPVSEYRKRLGEAEKVANALDFLLITPEYEPEEWLEDVLGLESEPERGQRCAACFAFNLHATAVKAKEMDFPIFTTTLSISPHKDTDMIMQAGRFAAQANGLQFLEMDFKKQDGFKRSLQMSQELDLYRQNYCGCRFSLRVNKDA
jgi:epoxyqueuosine reductase